MDYFRAGGGGNDDPESERKRKRDDALAWAKKRREQRQQREAAAAAAAASGEETLAAQGSGWGLDSLNPWGSKRTGPLPTKASLRPEPEHKFFGLITTSQRRDVDEEIGYQYEASMMDKVRWKLIDVKHKVTPSRSRCCCCCSCSLCIVVVIIIAAIMLAIVVIGFIIKHPQLLAL